MGSWTKITVFVFCLAGFFAMSGSVQAASNLVTNGDFSTGDSTGWTVIENGGSGATFTGNTYATSYNWCSISQTIDLVAAGYSAAQLDAAPDIAFDITTWQRFDHDGQYYLEYKLLEADGVTVATSSLYGSVSAPIHLNRDTAAFQTPYTFSGYGSGVRYAYIKIAGQDGPNDANWGGQYGPYFTNATTTVIDATNPAVSYLSPADNATGVGVSNTFEIAFNEAIATSTGNIVLYKASDNSVVETISIESALVTASGTTALIIDPLTVLANETGYYFMIAATAIDDTSGNSYAGITDSSTWNFTTTGCSADNFAGGDGSSGNPYQVSSLDQLNAVRTCLDKYFIQTANINASSTAAWNGGEGWNPIGDDSNYFTGSYDGGGYTINGLYINRPASDYQGLFGWVDGVDGGGYTSTIENLGLTNANIIGDYRIGTLAGRFVDTLIDNCYATGSVTSGAATGAWSNAGGLLGSSWRGKIQYSWANVTVTADGYRNGGLVGQMWDDNDDSSQIHYSYSLGDVIGGSSNTGGLVGMMNGGILSNSYARGDVTRSSGVSDTAFGAFVGGWYDDNPQVTNSYSTGNVYYAGTTDPTTKGFAGESLNGSNNFFDSEASNQSSSLSATARNTTQMKTQSTFTSAGWDFDSIWGIDVSINDGYPYLLEQDSAPTLLYLSPADNSTGVGVNATFEIAFDEAIATSTGNIYLRKSSDDSLVETIDIADTTGKITASGTTAIIINPSTTLDSETEYYFTVASTTIDDLVGNSYAGFTATSTWNFTTADAEAPTVIYFNPADNSTNVGVNSTFEIAFNEAIATSTGNIVLYKAGDDSVVETIDITDTTGKITASGTTAIINPGTTLDSETAYYFTIASTTIDDLVGNSYAGATTTTTWNFTTADVANPTVLYLNPADNSTGVAIDSTFEIAFNEAIATSSGNIVIYKTSDDSVFETIDIATTTGRITASGTTAIIIDPATDFDYATGYYITIASTTIDDASGNSYLGATTTTTWNFTTVDTPTCPSIANAATYNAWPTCGVATCNTGYTLTGDECVADASGNSTPVQPPSIGSGQVDQFIPMYETRPVNEIKPAGTNVLMYIQSTADFNALVSQALIIENHHLKIVSLDTISQKIKIELFSAPKTAELMVGERKQFDLDNDGIYDIAVIYNELLINRIDLTIEQLGFGQKPAAENENQDLKESLNKTLIKYPDSPKVYKLENGQKRWIFDEETFNYFKYSWSDIAVLNNIQAYADGPIIIMPENMENNGFEFTRDLYLGLTGIDVKQLQIYLNNHGFTVAETGYGSPGNETEFFGPATRAALISFQQANSISPAMGYFGPVTRGMVE